MFLSGNGFPSGWIEGKRQFLVVAPISTEGMAPGMAFNTLVCYAWNIGTQNWDVFSSVPRDNCDGYGLCGTYRNNVIWEAPICQCFKGFKPKGNFMDWSQGCLTF
nr:putative inactive G-type lectin S-receptor-like serine/threonine-protein kinase SRK [Ziziphus jujuba var. spinosa]